MHDIDDGLGDSPQPWLRSGKPFVLAVLLVTAVLVVRGINAYRRVAPGQTWIYVCDRDNPWATATTNRYEVLDVRDGWVRYAEYCRSGVYERHEKLMWFRAGAKKVSDGK